MQEVIFYADDYDTLLGEAIRLGFTSNDSMGTQQIIANGFLSNGGGYFFNYVGLVYEPIPPGKYGEKNPPPDPIAIPGVWARLRINGEVAEMPEFSPNIHRYVYSVKANRWVDVDSREFAPDWIGDIGVIA